MSFSKEIYGLTAVRGEGQLGGGEICKTGLERDSTKGIGQKFFYQSSTETSQIHKPKEGREKHQLACANLSFNSVLLSISHEDVANQHGTT